MKIIRSVDTSELKETRVLPNADSSTIKIVSTIFLLSTAYATIRYNVIKGVDWSDWPLYTLNKVFGVTSLLLIVLAVVRYGLRSMYSNAKILHMAGLFAGIHILLSFMLLSPLYYPKFFLDGKLTILASLSMLLGSIAAVIFMNGAVQKGERKTSEKIRSLATISAIISLHVAFQGYQSWLTPSAWPGFIPPITLLSFLASVTAIGIAVYSNRTAQKFKL